MSWTETAGFPFSDLGNLTATVILGWYTWYTASKTLPAIVNAFREEMGVMRAECRAERESLYEAMAAQRLQFHNDHGALVEAMHRLAGRLPPDGRKYE